MFRARPNLRIRGVDWPLFAIVGGAATALAWLVVVVQAPDTRYAGLGWLAVGFLVYAIYRRRRPPQPLSRPFAPPVMVLGPSLTVEYRTIVVPVALGGVRGGARRAARLAAERRATVVVVHVIEVPLDLPIDAELPERRKSQRSARQRARARRELRRPRGRPACCVRAAGAAIVEEAERRNAEMSSSGAPRARPRRTRIFGRRSTTSSSTADPGDDRRRPGGVRHDHVRPLRPARRPRARAHRPDRPASAAGSAPDRRAVHPRRRALAVVPSTPAWPEAPRPPARPRRPVARRRRLRRDRLVALLRLGVVAFYALGLTPWVLLGVGLLFLLVSLSYAEGTARSPSPAARPPSSAAPSTTRPAS